MWTKKGVMLVITGFVSIGNRLYCVMDSGIALEIKGEVNMISKTEMQDKITEMQNQYKEMEKRMGFIKQMEVV